MKKMAATKVDCSSGKPIEKNKIVIIGAGPTGLGAALRCHDLGHDNWTLVADSPAGGLAQSIVDDHGFTWDIGGHVIFSHYSYFDDVMAYTTDEAVGWNVHERESWVFCCGKWVPYPFQNNIHRLPKEPQEKCLNGLLDVYKEKIEKKPENFEEYFTKQFGAGIADIFMRPYNFKVWATPPRLMSTEWMGERVAVPDLRRICHNIIHGSDDAGWGPNATFRFPIHGGTGGIWTRLASKLPQSKMNCGAEKRVIKVDAEKKVITLSDGSIVEYDALVSTIPYNDFLRITTGPFDSSEWGNIADKMQFSGTHVIGLGIKGSPPPHLQTKCWMYFPEDSSPFYRATVFSNYAKANAPEGHWSLMLEVSQSEHKPVQRDTLMDDCIAGCIASELLTAHDQIVSKFHYYASRGYPIPFIGRNALLDAAEPILRSHGIFSRGRFGGWKYEVANMDHSLMQGVEAVDAILTGAAEETFTHPDVVNGRKKNSDRRLSFVVEQEKPK